MFYQLLGEEPNHASKRMTDLIIFCNQFGYHELAHQPVITLVKISSTTGEIEGHAVVLHSYNRGEDYLVLLTIDSASQSGYTFVFCSIVNDNSRPELLVGEFKDQLCLGHRNCHVIYLD